MDKICIRGMDLHYGDFHALKSINLDIAPNEITAFIGPSGCGKSTLLRSLNRMNDLVEGCKITGNIMLDGEDIYRDCDVNILRKRVGMVFQKPNPFPMSIYDNIAYGPRTHGIKSRVRLDEPRSAAPQSGRKPRTTSKSPRCPCPAVSSSVCASPVRLQPIPRCC